MRLTLEDGTEVSIGDAADLAPFLRKIDSNRTSFAILASADEHYVQTVLSEGGFIIEKRLGNHASHFEATRTAPDSWWRRRQGHGGNSGAMTT